MTAPADSDSDLRDWCQIMHCRRPSDMIYLRVGLCDHHYNEACQIGSEDLQDKLAFLAENLCTAAVAAVDWTAT